MNAKTKARQMARLAAVEAHARGGIWTKRDEEQDANDPRAWTVRQAHDEGEVCNGAKLGRYLVVTVDPNDGSDATWATTHNTRAACASAILDAVNGEYLWDVAQVLDLDTGTEVPFAFAVRWL